MAVAAPDRLHYTDSDEANQLIATDPLALLIGFALDQQVTVPTAFSGPLKLKQRLGALVSKKQQETVLAYIKKGVDEGAQLVADLKPKPPMKMVGHVTSSYYSPNVGRSIALALVEGGRRRMGETLHAPLSDRNVELTVVEPRFFDPEGARLNG